MNREAALLGVPVYSFFRGKSGSLDSNLAAAGKLVFITSQDEVDKIPCQHQDHPQHHPCGPEVKQFVLRFLIELINRQRNRTRPSS